jgi:pre-mRNA-splicing factor ATP-dependent RNA helicase DHX15/PRP43
MTDNPNIGPLAQLDVRNPLTGAAYTGSYWKLLEQRKKLTVWKHRDRFMQLLDQFQFILLEAETGSGKTTQIPQW